MQPIRFRAILFVLHLGFCQSKLLSNLRLFLIFINIINIVSRRRLCGLAILTNLHPLSPNPDRPFWKSDHHRFQTTASLDQRLACRLLPARRSVVWLWNASRCMCKPLQMLSRVQPAGKSSRTLLNDAHRFQCNNLSSHHWNVLHDGI